MQPFLGSVSNQQRQLPFTDHELGNKERYFSIPLGREMGLKNFSPAPENLHSLRPSVSEENQAWHFVFDTKVQKELNECGVMGGEGAFPPSIFKETSKDSIVYSTEDTWLRGSPLVQNYACTILAGSRSVQQLGLVSKDS